MALSGREEEEGDWRGREKKREKRTERLMEMMEGMPATREKEEEEGAGWGAARLMDGRAAALERVLSCLSGEGKQHRVLPRSGKRKAGSGRGAMRDPVDVALRPLKGINLALERAPLQHVATTAHHCQRTHSETCRGLCWKQCGRHCTCSPLFVAVEGDLRLSQRRINL